MFGKLFKKIILPAAKKIVEKEIEKKTGLPVKVDDILSAGGKFL